MKLYRVLVLASLGLSSCDAAPPQSSAPDAAFSESTPNTLALQSPTPRVSSSQAPDARLTPVKQPSPTPYKIDTVAGGNLPLRLPAPPRPISRNDARIAALQAKIRRAQIFAAYQQLSKIYLSLGRYDDAAKTLRAEAAQYRRKGFSDAAIIRERQASRYETQFQLDIDRFPTASEQQVTRYRRPPGTN